METLGFLSAGLMLVGAGLGRWTRWHPLLIGAGMGVLAMLPALLVAGLMMSPSAGTFALIIGLVAAGPASFGAFMGWLRRRHMERIS